MSELPPNNHPTPKKKGPSDNTVYAVYLGLGLSFATELAVATGLGWWLGSKADQRWGIAPWGMLLGIVLFLAVAFWHGLQMLLRVQAKLERDE